MVQGHKYVKIRTNKVKILKEKSNFLNRKQTFSNEHFTVGLIAFLTSRQHFSGRFLGFVHLIAAVLFLSLLLCGSIFLFKGLEKESILCGGGKEILKN